MLLHDKKGYDVGSLSHLGRQYPYHRHPWIRGAGELLRKWRFFVIRRIAMPLLAALLAVMTVVTANADGECAPPMPSAEELAVMAERAAQLGLPQGVIQLSPCEPGMGEHWADPRDMPFGPIYGVVGDEVVFVEVMPSQEAFGAGESWTETLVPLPGYAIDHVDIEFVPNGHPGYEIPHYDIHAYFTSHETHLDYCPAGQ